MQNNTPLFPNIHLPTLRRKPRSAQQRLRDEYDKLRAKSFDQLGAAFTRFIDESHLKPARNGPQSRHRIFSKKNTFWAFMGQVLSEDGSCQEVVHKLQAYAAVNRQPLPSAATTAYCKARARLDEESLRHILRESAVSMEQLSASEHTWQGRNVIVADGTGVSMPDTASNQALWPQSAEQKPGCGFPFAKLVGCFSLKTGGLLSWACGNKHDHEVKLLRRLWDVFASGDILLADKGFCSYFDIASLKKRGVDSVVNLHQRRRAFSRREATRVLGKNDLLIQWKRPQKLNPGIPDEQWNKLPNFLTLRQVKITVQVPGFRTQGFYLITTLLDAQTFPVEALADLYMRRWEVELFFRHIKTTMGMDVLRCKTPAMVRKEMLMHLIAYNCIRRLMFEAAEESALSVSRLSFKGAVEALRHWEPHLNGACQSQRERFRLISNLYEGIASNTVPLRPGRTEPRAVKRRRKNHRLMTRPRHEMVVPKHRNRNWENKRHNVLS